MNKKILEIGPGRMPSHHKGTVELSEDDQYTAIDQSANVYNSDEWRKLKKRYGDRVQLLTGDRKELPEGVYDEIISLGSYGDDVEHIIEQATRFLAPGGKLVFGIRCGELNNSADFLDQYKQIAKAHGLIFDRSQKQTYDYGKLLSAHAGEDRPRSLYSILTFIHE